jgi:uncharacterized protein YyaL (SSP411 family)
MNGQRFSNALVHETSPYLLQHAHNPVNWLPWGQEALDRARAEDKPILLSIGYSACHWCHVMERESFENVEIARIMNAHFVCVKVDREERPDLDTIYMSAVQMMTGGGGWPLTVFLTPQLLPFYGGTYFPPQEMRGMVGFPRLLTSIAQAFRERRSDIEKDSMAVAAALRSGEDMAGKERQADLQVLDTALSGLASSYDFQNGGFGQAPKFPPAMTLSFLLRSYLRTRNTNILEMAEQTLVRMARGGIYDQIGGGFHRYSVDARWLVPHFEKMLYDNALLSRIYLEAWLLTKKELYRRVVVETLDYVAREMTSPEGGFFSTQDADSEGEEGKYYLWTREEVTGLLGPPDAEVFCKYYGVTPAGNFEHSNILHISGEEIPNNEDLAPILRGKARLLAARESRIRPGRDEKILTAWNGLMIRSFAEAANGLNRPDYAGIASRAADFVLSRLQTGGRLLRTFGSGQSKLNAYLEDYSCMADALLSLYEATFDPRWLREAEHLATVIVEQFRDDAAPGFYFTSSDHEELPQRPKEWFDNATPSGNSEAAWTLLRLSKFTLDEKWAALAQALLESMSEPMSLHPLAFGNLLCALDFHLASAKEIAVVGDPAGQDTGRLLREIFDRYLPNRVVVCGKSDTLPLLRARSEKEGRPAAFVCAYGACSTPITEPAELGRLLEGN